MSLSIYSSSCVGSSSVARSDEIDVRTPHPTPQLYHYYPPAVATSPWKPTHADTHSQHSIYSPYLLGHRRHSRRRRRRPSGWQKKPRFYFLILFFLSFFPPFLDSHHHKQRARFYKKKRTRWFKKKAAPSWLPSRRKKKAWSFLKEINKRRKRLATLLRCRAGSNDSTAASIWDFAPRARARCSNFAGKKTKENQQRRTIVSLKSSAV